MTIRPTRPMSALGDFPSGRITHSLSSWEICSQNVCKRLSTRPEAIDMLRAG